MSRYRLSRLARTDIIDILAWSATHFGSAARTRYESLLTTAISDFAADPIRPGSKSRADIGPGIRTWHLRTSRRGRSEASQVRTPRHFLVYRIEGGVVVIGRVLHDAMDVPTHIEDGSFGPASPSA